MDEPQILNPVQYRDKQFLQELKQTKSIKIRNELERQLTEIWEIRNPSKIGKRKAKIELKKFIKTWPKKNTRWVYFPWRKVLLYLLSKEFLFELKTNRNKNLILKQEQNKLHQTAVGFFGLSMGSHGVLTWVMQAHPEVIKIADYDRIDGSNLNRIRIGWQELGMEKTISLTHQLYEMNPYMKIHAYRKGVRFDNIERIFDDKSKLQIVVDEIDDPQIKILVRIKARERKIPVIMAIDVADNVILDVERYDINNGIPIFHGRISNPKKILARQLTFKEKKQLIVEMVGLENNPPRMFSSLAEIDRTLVTWPQLGATATICGGVIVTAIKKIVLNEKLPSKRYIIRLKDLLY